jgi:hypothetical protein
MPASPDGFEVCFLAILIKSFIIENSWFGLDKSAYKT